MLDDLVLLRLLTVPTDALGVTRSRVAGDLRPYSSGGGFAAAVDRLAQAGQVLATGRRGGRLQLTDAGRARARAVFGVPAGAPPARRGWAWHRDRYAVPHALGDPRANSAEALRAALLRRLYLPELSGNPPADSLLATVDLLLAKRLRTPRASAGAFRAAALRAWVEGEAACAPPTPSATAASVVPLPGDLPGFAEQVRSVARGSQSGRFGDNKVFVSQVWRALLAAGRAVPDGESAFKEKLLRANTAGLLRLSRADLAGAHDPGDVRASEILYLGEKFHFLRLD